VSGGSEGRTEPSRGRPPKDESAPWGPDQVERAVIAAATQLFYDRGLANVSVREIAAAAGVNPALVHRYIGGKDAVLRAVLADLLRGLRGDLEQFVGEDLPVLPPGPEKLIATHQRIIAHLVLEGYDINDYQAEFPLTSYVIEEIQRLYGTDAHTARVRGAQIFSLDLAWRLFEPLLVRAAGFEEDDIDELRRMVRQINFSISEAD
jgi:AcrR family transcriptional regulator